MPTLDFKGKQFVYAHHLSVPFKQLDIDEKKSLPKDGKPSLDDNLIIHGDNLHALKALLPKYAGKVKCIYIDPPYNTGNEGWCYNDKVNAPLIKEWLKKEANPVDKEDLERHDKWLCMMWPRLQLLRELLSDDGVIFVSIDDNEVQNLRCLMDEIFDQKNMLANLVWNLGTGTTAGHFTRSHEYVLAYAKRKSNLSNFFSPDGGKIRHGALKRISKKNPASVINFPAGVEFEGEDAEFSGIIGGSEIQTILDEKMTFKGGKLEQPVNIEAGWAMKDLIVKWLRGEDVVDSKGQKLEKIYFNKSGIVCYEKRRTIVNPKTVISGVANTKHGSSELSEILDKNGFDYPKPSSLVQYLIYTLTADHEDAVILDSFAGSGTTAHAVLDLNKKDGGNRKFILVECEGYANDITAERVRRVIKGVPDAKDDALREGLGGSFTFCDLGQEINIENLLKGENLPEHDELARYAFYTATGLTLDNVWQGADYFIGETENYRVHLIYKPDLQFLRSGDSALNMPLAKSISAVRDGTGKSALVFATHKFMGQKELTDMGITYCQLPYAIHRVMGD